MSSVFWEKAVDLFAVKLFLGHLIHHKKGFTLVELVVVITIMGIFTGAITVSVDQANSNTRLSNAATRAIADLRYAQEMAMTHRREVNFYVYAATEKYESKFHDTGAYVPSGINGEDLVVQLDDEDYKGVVITSSALGGGRLSFTSLGKPLLNGANLPSDEMSVMYLNSKIHVIIVSSGYAYLAETVGGGGCGVGC